MIAKALDAATRKAFQGLAELETNRRVKKQTRQLVQDTILTELAPHMVFTCSRTEGFDSAEILRKYAYLVAPALIKSALAACAGG